MNLWYAASNDSVPKLLDGVRWTDLDYWPRLAWKCPKQARKRGATPGFFVLWVRATRPFWLEQSAGVAPSVTSLQAKFKRYDASLTPGPLGSTISI